MPAEIIKKVKKLEIKTKRLVDGLIQGAYHSVFKGRGIEFSEVREYEIGDDVRAIDWNVTARMNRPFIKEFIEERDLTVYIIFDVSASNDFGSDIEKKRTSIEIAASLLFAALRNNDKMGLALFSDKVEKFIPPRKGKKHALKLIRALVDFTPKSKTTDINETLAYLSKIIKKRSIMFIVSDFFSKPFLKPLRVLKRKHDIIAININDPRELEIPDIGYIELEDPETGEQLLVDTSDKGFRAEYKRLIQQRINALEKNFARYNVDMIGLKTGEPFSTPLRRFFQMRVRRR